MQKFKIIIAYDGTDFNGWQIQPTATTITSTLQKTFMQVFGKKINTIGASRTDSGVHALHQVAMFKSNLKIPCKKMLQAWNGQLPKSIIIRRLELSDNDFHPCIDVEQKTYYYHLFLKKPLPFVARYGFFYDFIHLVDWEKFTQALSFYVGIHDFASFCKIDADNPKNTVRRIDSISIKKLTRFGVIQIQIRGKSFLRFQIRRMIGYALDVARRKDFSIDYIKKMLNNPNPQQNLLKAPGCGLCLRKIVYKNEYLIKK